VAEWALGFPAESPGVWVWETAAAVAAAGDPPTLRYLAAPPELEDFVEDVAKALRAERPVVMRLRAQQLARAAVPLLLDLNPADVVRTRVEAFEAACAFRLAPDGWRDDFPALLGVVAADDDAVREAVRRVGAGVLRLLREHGSRVGDAQPELTTYLHDGTLERHLAL
jgi:hypothetical protein